MSKPQSLKDPLYFTVSTAGHVDHGKTSMLRGLTGIDPDRLKEEKQRQMTTDLGFAHLDVTADEARSAAGGTGRDMVIGFIDVPGHGKFLKNMLAGVGGLDLALLVVAADEGPMPQTVQHVKILSILGVRRVLIVLSKVDMVPGAHQDEMLEKTGALLKRFDLDISGKVKISNTEKSGFDELKSALVRALSSLSGRSERTLNSPAFLPIDRVFSKSGYGVVVTGTLVRGSIKTGDNLFIEPGGLKARVRGLETFGAGLEKASAGQRLAVNLALKEGKDIARGQVLAGRDVAPTKTLIVEIGQPGNETDDDFEDAITSQPARLYHGTAECAGAVRWLEKISKEDGRQVFYGQVALFDPVVAEPGDRFVLRYGDHGLAGGKILINTRPRWLTREKLKGVVEKMYGGSIESAVTAYLDAHPQGLAKESTLEAIIARVDLPGTVEALLKTGKASRLGDYLPTNETRAVLSERLIKEVKKAFDPSNDAQAQVKSSLESIRMRVATGLDRSAFQALVKEQVDAGVIVKQQDRLLPCEALGRKSDSEIETLAKKVNEILSANICLEIDELANQLKSDKKRIAAAVNLLISRSEAAIVGYEFACSTRTISQAHNELARLWQLKRDISPGDFREAMGTTRKYAMAMLAYFDDQAITRRLPSGRVLLKAPK